MNSIVLTLHEKGRCCGKKPLTYKRKGHLFCCRCNAQYGIEDLQQQENWAWRRINGGFEPVYSIQPTGDIHPGYIKMLQENGLAPPAIRWQHYCPEIGAHTNEHHHSFLKCRCFEGDSFLAAQDAIAVKLDA